MFETRSIRMIWIKVFCVILEISIWLVINFVSVVGIRVVVIFSVFGVRLVSIVCSVMVSG